MPYDLEACERLLREAGPTEEGAREAIKAAGGVCGATLHTPAGNRILDVHDETGAAPVDFIYVRGV